MPPKLRLAGEELCCDRKNEDAERKRASKARFCKTTPSEKKTDH